MPPAAGSCCTGALARAAPLAAPRDRRTRLALAALGVSSAAACGVALQLAKLAMADGAGRQLGGGSYGARAAFLAPFAAAKALANLAAGAVADGAWGRRAPALMAWAAAAVALPSLASAAGGLAGEGRVAGAWVLFALTAAALGAQQGVTWSLALVFAIDVAGDGLRGLASGVVESLGYGAAAAMAPLYDAWEGAAVRCAWREPAPAQVGTECAAAQNATCAAPDDWRPACAGECVCEGYMGAFRVVALVCVAGFVLVLVGMYETAPGLGGGALSGVSAGAFVELVEGGSNSEGMDGMDGGLEGSADLEGVSLVAADEDAAAAAKGDGDGRRAEHGETGARIAPGASRREVWWQTLWLNRSTAAMCAAGFVTNGVTGLIWGVISVWARDAAGVPGERRDAALGAYALGKGLVQLGAGALSDWAGRRAIVAGGLAVNAGALCALAVAAAGGTGADAAARWLIGCSIVLGLGTGALYPVLAAGVCDHAPRRVQATAVGAFRFARDAGYAAGALAGLLADAGSASAAMGVCAAASVGASALVAVRFTEAA